MFVLFAATVCFNLAFSLSGGYLEHYEVKPRPGDAATTLLARYHLFGPTCNEDEFYRLNNLTAKDQLKLHQSYRLPILIYSYDGKSIRSTIDDPDYQKALRIEHYNEKILKEKLRKTHYRDSKLLWVPYHELNCSSSETTTSKASKMRSLLGEGYRHEVKGKSMKNRVVYLVAGHGGPDPGATGTRNGTTLCEDEYAYDVALRLFRLIVEHGGHPEMIIEDPKDGIRDGQELNCDHDELCNGEPIPLNQLARLKQRVERINQLYRANKKKGLHNQTCVSLHIDSRSRNQRQDVFFCHYGLSRGSRTLARNLQSVFASKYKKHRSNGKYEGTVESRNLFILKNTLPKAVLIELANIQNESDHQRILLDSNREALAKWIFEGLGGKYGK